jgi:glycosyltransferase involved in cell wall biosynthesis
MTIVYYNANTMKSPRVTVLMPVYNAEQYLKSAIDSILNQTFQDFEFLIIDDGSTDTSQAIISSYTDPRIRSIHEQKNRGIAAALNKGFDLAQGEYIARMDSDDISLPHRLETQVRFMDSHSEVGVSGTWIKKKKNWFSVTERMPTDHEHIAALLLFVNPLRHPTIMLRTSVIRSQALYYSDQFPHAEDYELWTRMISLSRFAIIPKPLLLYRIHHDQITQSDKHVHESIRAIHRRELESWGLHPLPQELDVHQGGVDSENSYKILMNNTEQWFLKLISYNTQVRKYNPQALMWAVHYQWLMIGGQYAFVGIVMWWYCWNSKIRRFIPLYASVGMWLKLFLKCLLRKKRLL